MGRFLWCAHLHLQRECSGIARMNRPDANHIPGQDGALRIADLDDHRVLPGSFGGGMVNRPLDVEGETRGGRRLCLRSGVKPETPLACGTAHGAPENALSAVRTFPRLAHGAHRPLPCQRRTTTLQRRGVVDLTFLPPELDLSPHLGSGGHRQAPSL